MRTFKRYLFFMILLTVNIGVVIFFPDIGKNSAVLTYNNMREVFRVLPPIFILLGLLDVWVPRETMVKYMGEGSGLKGVLLAFFLGSAAAGPLYAAFPVAGMLIKKGSKFSNVLIFIGAWSTTKLPTLLFEYSALGPGFTVTRMIVNIFGVLVIATMTEKLLGNAEKQKIYDEAG